MADPLSLEDLEIVGYAEVLLDSALPVIVPPVYRLRTEPDRVFVPPFSVTGGSLRNATEITAEELLDLEAREQVTRFDPNLILPAQRGFVLWVDQSFTPQYQPLPEARQNLETIARQEQEKAEQALRRGDLKEAGRHAGRAQAANDRRMEPLAIRAAIRRKEGRKAGVVLMEEAAAVHGHDLKTFREVTERYLSIIPTMTGVLPGMNRQNSLYMMACQR